MRRVSLTAAPTDLIAQGLYNKKVPVVIGSNRDESALFFKSSQDGHYTESQLDGYMEWAYSKPGQAAAIKSIYENSSSGYEVRSKTAEGKGGGHCMRKNGTFAKTGSGQPYANVEKGPAVFLAVSNRSGVGWLDASVLGGHAGAD